MLVFYFYCRPLFLFIISVLCRVLDLVLMRVLPGFSYPVSMRRAFPKGDVAVCRFVYVCHAVHLVFAPMPCSFKALIASHLCNRYVLAVIHEQSPDVVNRNSFLATSLTHIDTHKWIDKHTLLHPISTSLDWLGLLVLTPVPVG